MDGAELRFVSGRGFEVVVNGWVVAKLTVEQVQMAVLPKQRSGHYMPGNPWNHQPGGGLKPEG